MKVKLTAWAEVNEDEYNNITSIKEEFEFIEKNLIDYDVDKNISREEWEEDGLEWDEEEFEWDEEE